MLASNKDGEGVLKLDIRFSSELMSSISVDHGNSFCIKMRFKTQFLNVQSIIGI